jgi:hypothetical protein
VQFCGRCVCVSLIPPRPVEKEVEMEIMQNTLDGHTPTPTQSPFHPPS